MFPLAARQVNSGSDWGTCQCVSLKLQVKGPLSEIWIANHQAKKGKGVCSNPQGLDGTKLLGKATRPQGKREQIRSVPLAELLSKHCKNSERQGGTNFTLKIPTHCQRMKQISSKLKKKMLSCQGTHISEEIHCKVH